MAGTEDDHGGLPLQEPSTLLGGGGGNEVAGKSPAKFPVDHAASTAAEVSREDRQARSQFATGERISHRYEIVRFIGRGAMGEVYEVNDTSLNEHVALKVISPEISSEERAVLRFKREIQLARKITHPNVCRIFDVGYHQREREEAGGGASFVFLTMELLQGRTLADRIYSQGPMSMPEALPVVEQLAAGLDAAHQAGVVHRDLKCGNVMLVSTKEGIRAVITDFGLARTSTTIETDSGSISVADEIVGTPDYMSPEQMKGAPVTPATDIYALGVVMYVALTGKLAFEGSTPRQRALKRLEQTPVSPRKYAQHLDGRWEKAILQCLSKESKDRPQSGADVVKVIRGEPAADFLLRPRYVYAAMIAVVILLLALAALTSIRQRLWKPLSSQVAPELKQLAILPFSAVNADEASIAFAKGLAETLTTHLSKLTEKHALQVIPATEIRSSHVENVQQARQEFGVNLALEGSVERAGPMVRVSYHLVDARNAHQLRGETITAPASDPFSLEDDVAGSVARALEIELNPQEKSVLAPTRTTEPAAYDFFLRGRGYLQDYLKPENLDSAISVFNHALELDPKYAPAYAGLGQAYWCRYEATRDISWITKATQACERAIQLDERSAEAHDCLGTVYQGTGKYELAALQFQRAVELDPTSDDAVRGLASSYSSLGKVTQAEETYRRAISLRPQYWRGYNMLGAFYYGHAHFDEAAKMFRQVIALAPDNYRGYSNFGAVYLVQGQYNDAVPLFERAVAIQPTADAYSNLATTYFHLRRFPESANTFQKAIKLNDRDYVVWGNLADAEDRTPGRRAEAETAYRKAISLAERELQVNPRDTDVLGNLADYYSMLGNRVQALVYLQKALSLGPEDASVRFKAAQVYVQLGDNDAAVHWLREALKAGYSRTIVRDSPVLDTLRSDPRVQGLLQSQ